MTQKAQVHTSGTERGSVVPTDYTPEKLCNFQYFMPELEKMLEFTPLLGHPSLYQASFEAGH